MKKFLAILSLALTLPFMATSVALSDSHDQDEDKGAGKRHEKMLAHMAIDLELTDDQQAKMKILFEEMQARRKALHEEHDAKLKLILSAEQYQQFREMRPPHHRGGKPGHGPRDKPEHCKMKKQQDDAPDDGSNQE